MIMMELTLSLPILSWEECSLKEKEKSWYERCCCLLLFLNKEAMVGGGDGVAAGSQ
jgi:hypothetical protein